MATDPINIAGVRWPNNFQNPTGIVKPAANPALDPTALNNAQQSTRFSKSQIHPNQRTPHQATDATKGGAIDT